MGVPVKCIKTIMRGQTYLQPGTVFEYPDQASADYAISRGIVTAHLDGPIKSVPAFEKTEDGAEVEIAPASDSEAPPESFITDPAPIAPVAHAPTKDHGRDNRSKRR